MSKVYLIKPLEKKSIVWQVEMYRENADGTMSSFSITETYRWGQGFIDYDLDCNLPYQGDKIVHAQTDVGWGSELEDSCSIYWEFSDDLDLDEQEYIKQCYQHGDPNDENVPDIGGAGWLFDGSHDWLLEDDYLEIIGPFKVSLCEEDGTVIEENAVLKTKPVRDKSTTSAKWPF